MDIEVEQREEGSERGGRAAGNQLRETVAVEPGGTLFVNLDVGSVRVQSHDANEVQVEATAQGRSPDLVVFSLEREGNDVYVEAEVEHWLSQLVFGRRVSVRALVPRRYSVDIRTRGGRIRLREIGGGVAAETKGGSIEVNGADGPALIRTAGGSVEAERINGDLRARTLGGHIEANVVDGSVDARTGGGHIEVRDVAGRVDASTSGGRVAASFTGPPEGVLETSGGSIQVRFPAGEGASLDARTSGGRVRVDHPVQVTGKLSSSHVVGEINGGGAELRLRTSGGGIRVRER